MAFIGLSALFGCKGSNDPAQWSSEKLDKWFEKGQWLGGWQVKPDASINRKELAVSYFKHKDRWDKAFAFLKNNDLSKLENKRYDIDNDNVYAPVSEYMSKEDSVARFEAHRKYIDIQYVVSGKELIAISPLAENKGILQPYNPEKDIEFVTIDPVVNHSATPATFFIFFPDDAHRPGVKDGESAMVKKVVIKVRID